MNIIERQWLLAHLHLVQHTIVANKAGLLLNPEGKILGSMMIKCKPKLLHHIYIIRLSHI